ncbi:diacylglycerol kinase 5-like [Canna indica]|uniref:Diacylglycerol kinase 5-like n=1 Tax=Canna indica TaxID=4628 RepID=A0AAQ3QLF4_9LILI|nr:diacylglycerol kinase 5-like [Canna indica]
MVGTVTAAMDDGWRNITQLANVKIMKRPGHWEDLHVPHRIAKKWKELRIEMDQLPQTRTKAQCFHS